MPGPGFGLSYWLSPSRSGLHVSYSLNTVKGGLYRGLEIRSQGLGSKLFKKVLFTELFRGVF